MAAAITQDNAIKRYAVVTGANKGIGFGICKQLASNGITVVLTARNERLGFEAVEKFKEFGLSHNVIFHQLDVTNLSSVHSLAEFVSTQFGKLDILVNNAGIGGVKADGEALRSSGLAGGIGGSPEKWSKILTETYDLAVDCLQTNYYGAKRMVETFIPLLQLSKSPRIVNVSSSMGKLKNIPNEWAKGVLSDAESLTEKKVDDVVDEFLKDFKQGSHKEKAWPPFMPAYIVSKAALSAYTRIIAKRYNPTVKINCVCPGFVKTDLNYNNGILSVEDGAESVVRLCLLPDDDGTSGLFFVRKEESSFE